MLAENTAAVTVSILLLLLAAEALHWVFRYIKLLRAALDPSGAGRGLFFSYGADITLTQQRYTEASAKGEHAGGNALLGERAEPRFFWNAHLLSPFTGPALLGLRAMPCACCMPC